MNKYERALARGVSEGFGLLILAVGLAGCDRSPPPGPPPVATAPVAVQTATPTPAIIRRTIAQPGSIQAFEQTPIYAKVPGYVSKWEVDIGDMVKKDQLLAELWVPELVSELNVKKEQVELANKALALAQAQVATAKAQIKEADAGLVRAEAVHDYWKGQNEHFAKLVNSNVLDKQTKEDANNQFRTAAAALTEAQARIASAKALLLEKEAARAKAEVDIRVAQAARQRQADLVRYATFLAPYDGVVTRRNINTFDFVQPPSAGKGEPLYVIERRDTMRIFVEIPEADAMWVSKGTPGRVKVPALQGREFSGKVARTSYAIDKTTRTLLAEIDLANPRDELRPGMYAYASIAAERPSVRTLPVSALATDGDVNIGFQSYCYIVEAGRAKRTAITVGARNDRLVEVLKKRVPATDSEGPRWIDFTGAEQVVRGDLSGLKDGQAVEVREPGK